MPPAPEVSNNSLINPLRIVGGPSPHGGGLGEAPASSTRRASVGGGHHQFLNIQAAQHDVSNESTLLSSFRGDGGAGGDVIICQLEDNVDVDLSSTPKDLGIASGGGNATMLAATTLNQLQDEHQSSGNFVTTLRL